MLQQLVWNLKRLKKNVYFVALDVDICNGDFVLSGDAVVSWCDVDTFYLGNILMSQ